MTEEEFLQLVSIVRKDQEISELDVALDDSPLDSLDLLELRADLERHLGRSLSEEKFVSTSNLRDLFDQVKQS